MVDALAAPVLGAALLLSIGTAQWWLLRRQVPRAWRWIAGTAAAWVTALGVFTAVTAPLWQPGQSIGRIVLIGVLGGLVMAAAIAAITGWAFVRLVTRAPASGVCPALSGRPYTPQWSVDGRHLRRVDPPPDLAAWAIAVRAADGDFRLPALGPRALPGPDIDAQPEGRCGGRGTT